MQTKHTQSTSSVRDEMTDGSTGRTPSGASFAARLLKFAGKGKPSPAPLPTPPKHAPVHQKAEARAMPQNVQVVNPASIKRNVHTPIPDHLKAHSDGLYSGWASTLRNQKALSRRAGIRFIQHGLVRRGVTHRQDITHIEAMLEVFQELAVRRGAILQNPEYTGRPPYPRYVLP